MRQYTFRPREHFATLPDALPLAFMLLIAADIRFARQLGAQGFVSVGAGVGGGVGDRKKATSDDSGNGLHGAAYALFRVPVIPFALRADALFAKTAGRGQCALVKRKCGLYIAPIPSYNRTSSPDMAQYGIGKDRLVIGWNAGLVLGSERHGWRFTVKRDGIGGNSRDLLTIGISR